VGDLSLDINYLRSIASPTQGRAASESFDQHLDFDGTRIATEVSALNFNDVFAAGLEQVKLMHAGTARALAQERRKATVADEGKGGRAGIDVVGL
jgi:hypothetical protein